MSEDNRRRTPSVVASGAAVGVAGLIGIAAGFLAGAMYGGNFAENFQLAGLRGYEATGLVGAIAGGACFVLTGVLLMRRSRSSVSTFHA